MVHLMIVRGVTVCCLNRLVILERVLYLVLVNLIKMDYRREEELSNVFLFFSLFKD